MVARCREIQKLFIWSILLASNRNNFKMVGKSKKKRNSKDSTSSNAGSGEGEEKKKKEGGKKKGGVGKSIGCDIFNDAAMENAYYVCHNVQVSNFVYIKLTIINKVNILGRS